MRFPNAPADSHVRDYLADRENLTGAARRSFFDFLDRHRAFVPALRTRSWTMLLLCSFALSVAALLLDRPPDRWLDAAVWPACFLTAAATAWQVRRHERHAFGLDLETEWRAYCLFLRPIILAERPGLIDRNAPTASDRGRVSTPPPWTLFLRLMRLRGLDYWWSCLVGLWGGMAALLVLRRFADEPGMRWDFLVPIAGLLLGPAIWSLWQAAVFRFARIDPRLRGGLD